jgi:hypothetical protein
MRTRPIPTITIPCEGCGEPIEQPDDPGRKRRTCSDACRQAAYRRRKRAQREHQRAREEQEAQARARERARRHQEEEARRQRERTHSQHRPPPHAATSRPGPWCGTCGGHRGPHAHHHDQAAHERARRRYEALRRKAAGTAYQPEAEACTAKAEHLRAKYGL